MDRYEQVADSAVRAFQDMQWQEGGNFGAGVATVAAILRKAFPERKTCIFCGAEFRLTEDGYLTCEKCCKKIKPEAYHEPTAAQPRDPGVEALWEELKNRLEDIRALTWDTDEPKTDLVDRMIAIKMFAEKAIAALAKGQEGKA